MRSSCLSLVLVLGADLIAQAQNPFVVFPQDPERHTITSASYVRRPDWNRQAEGFQELSGDWFHGIGEVGNGCIAFGLYHWAADENMSTSETYGLILRSSDPIGQPDITAAGTILSVPGLTTPTGAAARGSWIMVDTFTSPVVLPCDQRWFQGIDFPANPLWPGSATTPGDGHSMWAADSPTIASPATVGENHRVGAPFVTWFTSPTGTIATTGWTYIMGVLVATPNLHVGGIDPLSSRTGTTGASSYGMNGLFPDITHGIDLRITDNFNVGGIALAAGSLGFANPPLPFPGVSGRLHIDIGTLATMGFAVMSGGAGTIPVVSAGTVPVSVIGTSFMFQAVVVDPTSGAAVFTNAQATGF